MRPPNIKLMGQSRWHGIDVGSYTYIDVADDFFRGAAGLIVLRTKEKPFVVHYDDGRQLRIVDDGFHWLQLAPEGRNWWLTAMYDEKCRPVQFYFDVSLENHILPDGMSYMRDLYLDIAMYPNGDVVVLDRNELDDARDRGNISEEEHSFALRTGGEIIEQFSRNPCVLAERCEKYLNLLKNNK